MKAPKRMWQALAETTIDVHRASSVDELAAAARAAARVAVAAARVEVVLDPAVRAGLDEPRTAGPAPGAEPGRLEALRDLGELVEARGAALDAWREVIARAGLPTPVSSWAAAPIHGPDGRIVGVVHATDTAEEPGLELDAPGLLHVVRAAESALASLGRLRAAERAARARDELVGMVSHDLRNPLNTIAMGLTLLERAPELAPHGGVLARLRRGTSRLNRLIGDLLDVTRIEAGTLVVEPAPLAPGAVIEEVVDLLAAQAAEKHIRVDVHVPAHAPVVLADRDRLVQVLMNLLGNAIKFTPEGGAVVVAAARHGDALRIEVRDSGTGIPTRDLPHVFDRFWQARSTAAQGTGLGLFIANGIVRAHGGAMQVESAEGLGTCVAFTLGLAPDVERAVRAEPVLAASA